MNEFRPIIGCQAKYPMGIIASDESNRKPVTSRPDHKFSRLAA